MPSEIVLKPCQLSTQHCFNCVELSAYLHGCSMDHIEHIVHLLLSFILGRVGHLFDKVRLADLAVVLDFFVQLDKVVHNIDEGKTLSKTAV